MPTTQGNIPHTVTIDGQAYTINSPTELTDMQAYTMVKQELERIKTQPPPGSDTGGAANYAQGKKDWLQWHEPTASAASGFLEGIPQGLKNIFVHLPASIVSQLYLASLTFDPATLVKMAYDKAKDAPNIPSTVMQKLTDARNLAVQDPHAFGKELGSAVTETYAGGKVANAIPTTLPPVLRSIGRGFTAIGEHPWMGKVSGAGMMGAGLYKGDIGLVAAGGATMAAPSVASTIGRKLQVLGGESPAVVKLGKKGVAALDEKFDHAMAKRNVSFYDEQQALKAEVDKVTQAEKLKEGLVAKPPTVTESVTGTTPEGVRKTGAIRFGAATPEKGGLTPDQQELLDEIARRDKTIGKDPRFAGIPKRTSSDAPVAPTAPGPTPPTMPQPMTPEATTVPIPDATASAARMPPEIVPFTGPQNAQLDRTYAQSRPVFDQMHNARPFGGYQRTFGGEPHVPPKSGMSPGMSPGFGNPASRIAPDMPPPVSPPLVDDLGQSLGGFAGPERRHTRGVAPTGMERRNEPITGLTNADRAAQIRQEIPSIDTDIRGMQGRGEAARAAQVEATQEGGSIPDADELTSHLISRETQIPMDQVRTNLSRRSPKSALNPVLTLDEEARFGFPAGTKITALSPQTRDRLYLEREMRQQAHRTHAGLDKGASSAYDRDRPEE